MTNKQEPRLICDIAVDIRKNWKQVNYAAVPYLQAMNQLGSINDSYGWDSGRSVVLYFLSNARTWKGPKAREIKSELNRMLKG